MEKIETLFPMWDEWHWEFTLAFEGLSDNDLWTRPDPRLLSIGEIACHVGYGEAMFAPGALANSPLADRRFRYYLVQVDEPVRLEMGVVELLEEVKRIHVAAKEAIAAHPNLDAPFPPQPEMSWRQKATYMLFHVAYHTGQAFSVRHLMGHKTNDN
jgi:hypothetical protein